MNKITALLMATSILFSATYASAYGLGGSNLTGYDYPRHRCNLPMKPYSNDKYSTQRYKQDLVAYAKCMETYINNCKNDANRAIQKAEEAQREFSRAADQLRN